jgi:phenylpropionate dioxygenase-like ring-hydroxylating dioxygenase large terminal subunit
MAVAELTPGQYTSADHHLVEREKLLWANWVSVARAEDLAAPGDYVAFDHAGEPVVATRGTTLVEGCGHANSLQCPYHLWTYDLTGRLVGSPGMEGLADFRREDHALPELAVDCWGGWVFVHLDPNARPLLESLPHLETTYPGAYFEKLVRIGRTRCQQAVNWKIIVENFIESYHHAGTHPETLQGPYPYQQIHEVDNHGEGWSSIEHRPAVEGLEPFAVPSIYPTHLFAIVRPDSVTWFRVEIPSHDRVDIDVQILATPEQAEIQGLAEGHVSMVEAINAEDVEINRRTWEGLQSRRAVMGPLSDYEEGVRRFRRWILDSLED